MPFYEYVCKREHLSTVFFKTFQAGSGVEAVSCQQCGEEAHRILSVPFPAHLHGNPDGYYKPSPQKRYSYKLMTERGNSDSAR